MKKKLLLPIALLLLVEITSYAQTDVVEFIKAGTEDANVLMKEYLNPFALSLGDGLNSGWFNSAENHKLLGFDFTVNLSAVQIPNSAKYFDLSGFTFTGVELDPKYGSISPTVAGNEEPGAKLNILDPNNPGDTLGSFRSPPGIDMNIVPIPMAQVGIGLFPHTDVVIRYVPELSFKQQGSNEDKVHVSMYGFGLKHGFKEWIPFLKNLPFDAAVFGSFSKIKSNTGINFQLEDYGYSSEEAGYTPDENQELKIEANTVKYGLIVSKKLSVLTVFGSISNSRSSTHVDLLGRYPVVSVDDNQQLVVEDEKDPIKLRFSSSRLSYNAGLRLSLGFFNIYSSINKAEYTSYNAGLSFSFR